MSAKIIDGKSLAATVRESVAQTIETLAAHGVRPGLAVVMAGDNPASRIYVRNKIRACEQTGVRWELHEYAHDVPEATLLERIEGLNRDPAVHGILVQLSGSLGSSGAWELVLIFMISLRSFFSGMKSGIVLL